MADGKKILAKADKIRKVKSGARVLLKTTAPVYSKTLKFLEEQGIEIISDNSPF